MENKYGAITNFDHIPNVVNRYNKRGYKIVGIEAEYGDRDITDIANSELVNASLAHHGPRHKNLPPCLRWDLYGQYDSDTFFIFSHFDTDAILGLMILEGVLPDNLQTRQLTELAGFVDIHGPHKAHEHRYNEEHGKTVQVVNFLISEFNMNVKTKRLRKLNFSDIIEDLKNDILEVMVDNAMRDEIYHIYTRNIQDKICSAYEKNLSQDGLLHVFTSSVSMMRNYSIECNGINSHANIVTQYNNKFKNISIAVYDKKQAIDIFGKNGVISILQSFFGNDAGGRTTIGGSPRNKEYTYNDFRKWVEYLYEYLLKEHA